LPRALLILLVLSAAVLLVGGSAMLYTAYRVNRDLNRLTRDVLTGPGSNENNSWD
jgi:hypothetical protein